LSNYDSVAVDLQLSQQLFYVKHTALEENIPARNGTHCGEGASFRLLVFLWQPCPCSRAEAVLWARKHASEEKPLSSQFEVPLLINQHHFTN